MEADLDHLKARWGITPKGLLSLVVLDCMEALLVYKQHTKTIWHIIYHQCSIFAWAAAED